VYIGGGSEISYWLQLKPFFETQNVLFPILMVRNSILLVKEKQVKKLNSLKISWEDLFLPIDSLINLKIKEKSTLKIPFLDLKKEITKLYSKVSKRATKTEKTFLFLVTAQKVRQLKAIDLLEKRLLKAEKIKYNQDTKRIIEIKSSLFPNNLLQERTMNFSEFYLEHGNQLFNKIYTSIKPLDFNFTVIVL
ncbi:MAG: bacillithiol biosynthesis BshC, partial [Solirubrobacteraceae bacterium]